MQKEATCNFEDIYYNMDENHSQQDTQEQHIKNLLNDQSSKTSINCSCIYRYLFSWFFPSHINSLYE